MRVDDSGHKIYKRGGMEGYSEEQVAFGLKVRKQFIEQYQFRLKDLSEEEQKTAQKVMAHAWAPWWIACAKAGKGFWTLMMEEMTSIVLEIGPRLST